MIIVHVLPLRSSSIYTLQQVSTQSQGCHIDLNSGSCRLAEDFSLTLHLQVNENQLFEC